MTVMNGLVGLTPCRYRILGTFVVSVVADEWCRSHGSVTSMWSLANWYRNKTTFALEQDVQDGGVQGVWFNPVKWIDYYAACSYKSRKGLKRGCHAWTQKAKPVACQGRRELITKNDGQKDYPLSLPHTLNRLLLSHWLQTCYLITIEVPLPEAD